MHNNYYFLRQLSSALEPVLMGTIISECFSQAKDELIIRFETYGKPFYIKASLASNFSALSFPGEFQRARKNSIDLFPGIIGHRVKGIRQFHNERSFALLLEEGKSLLFKMHGNRSNLILFEGEHPTVLFRNNIPADSEIHFSSIDRTIDWSLDAFQATDPQRLYFTFGKVVWQYLDTLDYSSKSLTEKWSLIQSIKEQLESPRYLLTLIKGQPHLSLLPLDPIVAEYKDPISAATEFYYRYTHDFTFNHEKAQFIAFLHNKVQSSERYYQKNFDKLAEIESDTNYKTWADLLMANLHVVNAGQEQVTFPDFYHPEQLVTIKLKKDLTPQKNAALFYRKAKNQHIEIDRLQSSLTQKEREIENIKIVLLKLDEIKDLKTLRKKIQELGFNNPKQESEENLPYHEFMVNGFRIWVGKNAKGNDELTFKYGYKEDLWLHAKDVPGSHVIIKHQSGKNFPKDVIERAAELAAYNSKRKTETLCPVAVTPKKFVRKRKGDPAGAVVVEREDVILVEPKL